MPGLGRLPSAKFLAKPGADTVSAFTLFCPDNAMCSLKRTAPEPMCPRTRRVGLRLEIKPHAELDYAGWLRAGDRSGVALVEGDIRQLKIRVVGHVERFTSKLHTPTFVNAEGFRHR